MAARHQQGQDDDGDNADAAFQCGCLAQRPHADVVIQAVNFADVTFEAVDVDDSRQDLSDIAAPPESSSNRAER